MKELNINLLVQEFYAIEAITAMLSSNQYSNFEPFKHSHGKWYLDFKDFKRRYVSKFASAIFDYTALVVAAELRHCKNKSSAYIKDYYTCSESRVSVYFDCKVYKARDILMAGIKMFDDEIIWWERQYGGSKWKQIAKAGLTKGTVKDCVFIDHCVDLSHNNSIYFDKGAGIFCMYGNAQYQEFLDKKRYCKPQELILVKQGCKFNKLLERAKNLNIIMASEINEDVLIEREKAEHLLFEYSPIEWGTERLNYFDHNLMYSDLPEDSERDDNYGLCA